MAFFTNQKKNQKTSREFMQKKKNNGEEKMKELRRYVGGLDLSH